MTDGGRRERVITLRIYQDLYGISRETMIKDLEKSLEMEGTQGHPVFL